MTNCRAPGEDRGTVERSGRFFTPGEFSRTLRTVTAAAAGTATCSTGTAGATTRSCAPPTGSTAPASCSWKVYVKDGIITWETQRPIIPSVGPDPRIRTRAARAAPRSPGTPIADPGAYPYVRGLLVETYREAKERTATLGAGVGGHRRPRTAAGYQQARGKGGLVRSTWPEACEDVAAAAHAHDQGTMARTGLRLLPIPAMSMVSHAAGVPFVRTDGRRDDVVLRLVRRPASVASPQVFGDQTDVPESGIGGTRRI